MGAGTGQVWMEASNEGMSFYCLGIVTYGMSQGYIPTLIIRQTPPFFYPPKVTNHPNSTVELSFTHKLKDSGGSSGFGRDESP